MAAVIECRDLWKAFGAQQVLRGANATFEAGITVVLGASGAGKTTLLRHIVGALRPDRGAVLVDGRAVHELDESHLLEVRRRMGVLFEDWKALFYGFTLYENIAFPLRHIGGRPDREIRTVVSGLLSELGIEGAAGLYPENLSAGMRTRGGVARAFVLDPEIVLLDRPEEGLDQVRVKLLFAWIKERQRRRGSTMIVISQDVDAALAIADRAVVLADGRLTDSGGVLGLLADRQC
jgi:phospholipid/cholesterol/gamma-HCH transport system ATP-binding protein